MFGVSMRAFAASLQLGVEELDACFVVFCDQSGQQLAYVYFEDEPGRRSAAKLLSKGEARWIQLQFRALSASPHANDGGRVLVRQQSCSAQSYEKLPTRWSVQL
jgi:hypothetical protein